MQAIAEVVSSSVTGFVAQSLPEQDDKPILKVGLGSFVRIESDKDDLEIVAVVHDVVTEPLDSVHKTSAFGLSREQLKLEQPQIFSLLRTDLHAVIVGFLKAGKAVHHLPPRPPEVHDFVFAAEKSEIEAITRSFEFLRLLNAVGSVPADELLAAAVREASLYQDNETNFLLKAGQAFSQLFRSDYDRLVSVLRKIRPEE
jgi:hypothetical protein